MNLIPAGLVALTLLAEALPDEVQSVVAGNNQFAFDMYRRLNEHDGNVFLSPYSITKTLAMTYTGARGDTAREMAATLHFPLDPNRHAHAFAATRKALNGKQTGIMPSVAGLLTSQHGVQLHLAASLWGQKGYVFEKTFLTLTQECYGAGLIEVDFHAPESARGAVNAWVDRETRHKIKDVLRPDSLNSNTRLLLVSAIYFKGDWLKQFPKSMTRDEPFRAGAGKQVPARMMNQTNVFGYFQTDDLQGLQLPYEGGKLAMLVLLPRKEEGLADLEKALTADRLAGWVNQLREQKVQASLPRFSATRTYSFADTLAALGMKKAFRSGEADFSGMNGGGESLWISAVEHRAFVDVNEEGTEAAAATGAAITTFGIESGPPVPVFRADHPFVFAIRDVQTGMILFLGRVVQP
jgi:serpin B